MDEAVAQEQEVKQPNKYRNTTIVLIIAVVVCIILGLFYFDILPIKSITSVTQPKNGTAKPTSAPTGFQYDTAKAEKLLTDYIEDTIKPEYLPEKIEVKQGLSGNNGVLESVKYKFGTFFTSKGSTISANFYYKENTNNLDGYIISIIPSSTRFTTPTVPLTNSLLASYFLSPFAVSSCQTKETISSCELFQDEVEGKKGYGVMNIDYSNGPKIFNCFIPKGSEYYEKSKSCLSHN